MQKTRYQQLLDSFLLIWNSFIYDSWSKRIILLLSILSGYYFTNSLTSFLLDKPINTIFLAIFILLIMELTIRSLLFSRIPRITMFLHAINNFRIGSTYALILEAYKLGS